MKLAEFQQQIEHIYYDRDSRRGIGGTFLWFMEEVGELATAIRREDADEMKGEFADVLAWLCTLASLCGVKMEEAAQKYAKGCPSCGSAPCTCSQK